jgi:ketosteroid isomerase-like protein
MESGILSRDTAQAMSQENVEIVRRLFEVFREGMERGDFVAGFDAELASDDLEWIALPGVGLGTYRGREGFIEFMRLWTGEFEHWWIELEQVIDAGDDRVVAIYRQTATGKASGVPVELHQGAINELRDGRVIRIRHYPSPAEALEAAGLSE